MRRHEEILSEVLSQSNTGVVGRPIMEEATPERLLLAMAVAQLQESRLEAQALRTELAALRSEIQAGQDRVMAHAKTQREESEKVRAAMFQQLGLPPNPGGGFYPRPPGGQRQETPPTVSPAGK